MSVVGLEVLDHSVQLTHQWINELDDALGWNDRHRSWRLLRAVLQTLRDCLPLEESAHLSAQLPLVLRGVYFEHWHPGVYPAMRLDRDVFFAKVHEFFARDPIEDIGDAVSVVLGVIENHVSEGEIRHVVSCLPATLRSLWTPIGET